MGLHQYIRTESRALKCITYKSSTMKIFCVVAILLVGALYTEAKKCQSNADCEPDGCCYGVGQWMWCHDFSHEGEWCSITSRYGCGCEPGLLCSRKGLWETCTRNSTMV